MISTVATFNLQQASAFGFVERQQIADLLRLTAQFDLFPSKTARSKKSIEEDPDKKWIITWNELKTGSISV
jgi:hypothetical protein